MTYTNESYKTRIARIYTSADENVINVVGGGFLISDQYIVTCAHVVTDALKINHKNQDKPLGLIKLDFPFSVGGNNQKFEANIILWKPRSNSDYSYEEDIAVLELSEKLPTNNVTFQLSLADTTNHQFSVLGFPKGRDQGVITKGKLLGTVGSGLVQIEVSNQSSFYIEPGFSGAPVWDEELVSFVGIVVSSELGKYSNNTVGKPADELRKDIKIAYMIPAKVLVDTCTLLQQFVQEKPVETHQTPIMQSSRKQQSIQKEIALLEKQYAAYEGQYLASIDPGQKIILKQQLNDLNQKIEQLEDELKNM